MIPKLFGGTGVRDTKPAKARLAPGSAQNPEAASQLHNEYIKPDSHFLEIARDDVLRTSRELLEIDERIETLKRALGEAQSARHWVALSHRAATIELRNAEALSFR